LNINPQNGEQSMAKPKSSKAQQNESSSTCWSTTQGRNTTSARYHGFPKYGDTGTSYCGIEFGGLKRMTPPDRDAAVCEHCAMACGFIRRPGRTRSRTRGSRNLGTSVERIEAAVDRFEALLIEWKEISK
jgi:hypothetical protein|tara:strand:+ start:132 stop:521 length:390 start_codon:yes stop_codon:yes gene_type:complete